MLIAQIISHFLIVYLCCGLFFGGTFITVGVGKVDSAARGSSVFFRLLILPGAAKTGTPVQAFFATTKL